MTHTAHPFRRRSRAGIALAVAAASVVALAGCSTDDSTDTSDSASESTPDTITIGVTDASEAHWKTFNELAKEKYGVTVEEVNFSDYSQPNPAVSQGQLDMNEFQHIQYLADYNVSADDDLQPIAPTAIYPLPLYSLDYDDPADIPDGAEVAVPDDAINQARGLLVLQAAGLLTLTDGGTPFSDLSDIESSDVEVTALNASQTAGALQNGSVAAAIVNNNYAVDAGLERENVLFEDDPDGDSAAPYVNIFVTRAEDADNELYKNVAALYQNDEVKKQVLEENGGSAVFRTTSAEDLQALQAEVEDDARAANE